MNGLFAPPWLLSRASSDQNDRGELRASHGALVEQGAIERGASIEIKGSSYNNVVRDNVVHDTNSTCIRTHATAGNGGPNVLERNVVWRCGDHGIAVEADAIVRNNIVLGAADNGISMQPHQNGAPDNLVIVHNTVLQPENSAIGVSDIAGPVVIANNAPRRYGR